MDYFRTIILILASVLSVTAQPFQQAELGWPNTRLKYQAVPSCATTAENSVAIFSENASGTIQLHGSGGAFSTTSTPLHGSLSGLDSVAGTVTYTPDSNFTGSDIFAFQVQSNSCISVGAVYVLVFDTNSTAQVCASVSSVGSVDTETTACSTTTPPGTTLCSTNESVISPLYTGTVCAANASCSLLATNIVSFNVSGSNPNYANWTICNPDSVSHIYKVAGHASWTITASGGGNGTEIDISSGAGGLNLVSHGFGSSATTGSENFSGTITIPAHTSNMPISAGLLFVSGSGGNFTGTFTNSFQ